MEWLQGIQSIDWMALSKIGAVYLGYFIFYVLLIQSTTIAVIKSISSIFYQSDTNTGSEVMAASVLWSIFILLQM